MHQVVDVLDQPGDLDGPFQLQLAPPAAHLRCPQRGDQLRGLGTQPVGRVPHRRQVLVQGGGGGEPVALGGVQLGLHLLQGVPDRADERLDRVLALGEVAGGDPPRRVQPGLGQFGQRPAGTSGPEPGGDAGHRAEQQAEQAEEQCGHAPMLTPASDSFAEGARTGCADRSRADRGVRAAGAISPGP